MMLCRRSVPLFVLFFTFSFQAGAQVPQRINYQGRLVGPTGLVNGTVSMQLRIYDALTLGAILYEDSNTVTVMDGLYATLIGDNTVTGTLAAALASTNAHLEIIVNGTPLTPRERIVAVAYAVTADGVKPQGITSNMIATGAISADHLRDGSISNADIAANAAIASSKIADGSGSGLDADLLDGEHSTSFSPTNHNHDLAYVNENQTNSVTTQMITDGTLQLVDIGKNGATNGQVLTWNNGASQWEPATPVAGGGGSTNLFWHLAGNTGVVSGTHFLGTLNSNIVEVRVDNQTVMRFEPNLYANIVGGQPSNSISRDTYGAIIAGGGHDTYANVIHPFAHHAAILGGWGHVIGTNAQGSGIGAGYQNAIGRNSDNGYIGGGRQNSIDGPGDEDTIGGGANNRINGTSPHGATIGGGHTNTVGGLESTISGGGGNTIAPECIASTIGGGFQNLIKNANSYDTIAGGYLNTIGGVFSAHDYSTIGGGAHNSASNDYATVPGGVSNAAVGIASFAAGTRAKALHAGAFVLSDSSAFDVASTNNNSWTVRCTGGARFISGINGSGTATSGVILAVGGNTWNNLSDRNVKENLAPIDVVDILERVAAMPITTWNMKTQDLAIRHIGPMAQDFHTAFPVGEDERYIPSSDADGVALAAIQGLYRVVQEQRKEIELLRGEVEKLKQEGNREITHPDL
ncbi:MAG: tail fiber domain-containing protein [bacterium]